MKNLYRWSLPAILLLAVGAGMPAQAVNLYLRSNLQTCIYGGTTSQTLQKASGTTQASLPFSTKSITFSFYSTPLTNSVLLAAGKKAGGTFGVQNNGTANFQFQASEIVYDYNPATGTMTRIVSVANSRWSANVGTNGKTGHVTLPQTKLGGGGKTVPAGHMLRVDITITVNINSGINGALIYNAGSGDGKSFVLLPSDNSIIWPFGAAASTPNATITVPTAVEQNSTGNTASVLDAGVGAIYSWTITNGTITAGQSTRQITWTAGPVGQAVLGVSIMNGCFSSSGATVVIVNTMTNQTIAFDPIPEQTYGSGPITLNATASSGLPVTFSVVAGPATVSGNTLTLTGAGTVVVDANQAGNSYCNPAVAQQSFTVDPALLTVSGITASNKVYDSSPITMLNTNISTLAGVVAGDDVTLDLTYAAGNFADAVVGAGKTVQISGLDITGGSAGNYTLIQPTSTADITPAGLTVSGAAANDKVYDGTTAAVVDMSNAALAGVVPGDDVTLNNAGATGSFSDKNAGTAKTVAVSGLALDGTDAGNYVLAPLSVTANISPAPLTVSAIAPNKVYDGTTTASATLTDNRVAGDSLSISYVAASFSNKAVGNGKPVTVSGIAVTGPDAANYTFNPTASTTANITAATVTGSVTANNKVYDGTTAATIATRSLTGTIAGDSVNLGGGLATFSDKNVGNGKTVTATGLSLTGTDSGNYSLAASSAATTANITPASLTVNATAANKVYDGTTTAPATLTDNRIIGDSLATSYTTANFSDRNVGIGKTVTVSGITVTGTDAANYTFNPTASTTANITAATVTGSITANNKVYDGTTAATIATRSLTGTIAGDSVNLGGGLATFSDKNVGNGKTVTATGLSLTGTDAGNYSLAASGASTTADITPALLTVNATAANKVYDGTTTASATLTDNRVAGDSLSISFVAADFSNKAVGDGKTVAVSGIAVTGPDAGNYAFNTTASAPANITAATVAGSITANNKIYDGSVAATIASRSLSGALGGDSVSLAGGAACFADPYVGNNKPVTATGLGLTGTDSGNYTLASSTATTTANIVGAQAPNITRLTISPDRWVHLLCAGSPGQTYLVQATANLNHPTWVVLSTNVISTNGTLSVLDSTATNYPARFYRAAVPQP